MRIIVAGGSGFLGRALVDACRSGGHEVTVLTRRPRGAGDVQWAPTARSGAIVDVLEHADAVVNLAGEGIADRRWTDERKTAILESRVTPTRTLADAILACSSPPAVFLSASGVGFYGARDGELKTENSPQGDDFLAKVCSTWEAEATRAATATRVVLLRTGLVLARNGGALPRMALPFHFFVGGRIGSGRQYMSWIHIDDWVAMVRWALQVDRVSGPLNVTAPSPVTNSEFSRALARSMRRPALLPVPSFALHLVLGAEMADTLLLGGQRAVPQKAQDLGCRYRYTTADAALDAIYEDLTRG